MNTRSRFPLNEMIAPALLLMLALSGAGWALPQGLPPWRSVAIVSAWLGTGLLVGSLLLMVRGPRLAALLGGLDVQYRWHHRSGTLAYVLLLLHPLAIALDAWTQSPQRAWQALAPWFQSWPLWLGWAGLLCLMLGLATTFSLNLPYRRWRALHYLPGIGVLCGLLHVWALLGEPGALWVFMALAVLALCWRLFGVDLGIAAHAYRVRSVVKPAARMIEAVLDPCGARLRVVPGQFVFAAFGNGPHFHGCGEFHPFTVSGIGADGSLAVGIKALGPCSTHVQALESGVLVRLEGPFGNFLAGRHSSAQLWIAGGIGITPFLAVLRRERLAHPTTLIYLYRSDADAAYLEELKVLAAADSALTLITMRADGAPDFDALLGNIEDVSGRVVHLCGPAPLIDAARASLDRHGVPGASIHFERFDFR